MKYLHNFNLSMYFITLILYLTIYFGLIAQILLGSTQVIIGIVLLLNSSLYSDKLKKLIKIYFLLVGLYFLFLTADIYVGDSIRHMTGLILIYIIIPMSIGGFFVYVTSIYNKELRATDVKRQRLYN